MLLINNIGSVQTIGRCTRVKNALYPSYEDLFKPGGDASNEMVFAIQNIGGGENYDAYGFIWESFFIWEHR